MHHQEAQAYPRSLEPWLVGHTNGAQAERHAERHTGTRNMHKQARTEANSPKNYPKMLSKCFKMALEMEPDGVLEALLIQTSIEDPLQVDFFQILHLQMEPFGTPKGATRPSLSLRKLASFQRWIFTPF